MNDRPSTASAVLIGTLILAVVAGVAVFVGVQELMHWLSQRLGAITGGIETLVELE